ncbi:hypothetical protein QYF61_017225 [Mycteria americana]|uniref:BPTI/Kunitz inhibitor domain-containing protein n=1 Tax=Mycteria americana TaxID=33587 RepID=A0AAN7RQM8_MYCAM|nr:hypothetical protein QYF61_017225 [Mycteria americana]
MSFFFFFLPAELCSLPKVVGRCRASMPRWWFNVTGGSCQSFVFGGCEGNANNFLTERECRESCVLGGGKVTAGGDTWCRSRPRGDPGIIPSYQIGNPAIAPSRPMPTPPTTVKPHRAVRRCRILSPLCFLGQRQENFGEGLRSTYPPPKSPAEHCAVPRVTGPCRASFLRWYYSPANQTCRQFIYGGCRGNKNNYQNEEECLSRCGPKPGEGQRDRPRVALGTSLCPPPPPPPPRPRLTPVFLPAEDTGGTGADFHGDFLSTEGKRWRGLRSPPPLVPATLRDISDVFFWGCPPPPPHTALALGVLLAILAAILLGYVTDVTLKTCRRKPELPAAGMGWSPGDDKEYLMSNAYTL